VIKGTNSKG
jgi:signal transduction histidine kinase